MTSRDEIRQAEENDRLDWLADGAARALADLEPEYPQCAGCPCHTVAEEGQFCAVCLYQSGVPASEAWRYYQ